MWQLPAWRRECGRHPRLPAPAPPASAESVAAATVAAAAVAASLTSPAGAHYVALLWHHGVHGRERVLRGPLPRRVGRSVQSRPRMEPEWLDTSGWQLCHDRVALWHGTLQLAHEILQPRQLSESGGRRRQPHWWWPACRLFPRLSLPSVIAAALESVASAATAAVAVVLATAGFAVPPVARFQLRLHSKPCCWYY